MMSDYLDYGDLTPTMFPEIFGLKEKKQNEEKNEDDKNE